MGASYDRRQHLIWHALHVLKIISPNPWDFLIKTLDTPAFVLRLKKTAIF